jgi:hypothetical protein
MGQHPPITRTIQTPHTSRQPRIQSTATIGLAEATLQRPGLDVLDGVPAELEVFGHVLDGHQPRQVQDVAFESTGVALHGIGEAQLHLTDLATVEAKNARDLQLQPHGLGADRHGVERAFDTSLIPDLGGAARRATMAFPRLFDVEGHPTALEGLLDVTVANEAKGVVQ